MRIEVIDITNIFQEEIFLQDFNKPVLIHVILMFRDAQFYGNCAMSIALL